MKKLLIGLTLLTSMTTFSSEIIGDLQYECSRVEQSQNTDIKTLSIYSASTFFNKQRAIVSDYGSLIETSYKRIEGGIALDYYSGYEKENELTISFSSQSSSKLVVGSRTVQMDCIAK